MQFNPVRMKALPTHQMLRMQTKTPDPLKPFDLLLQKFNVAWVSITKRSWCCIRR